MAIKKEDQNIADAEFILGELERFALMPPQAVMQHIKENRADAFATLSLPKGGMIFCGRAAYRRFDELADRTTKPGSADAQMFAHHDYVQALRSAFVELFVEQHRGVNKSSVAKLVRRGKQLAREEFVSFTHHIPCQLFFEKAPDKFNVGPVKFSTVTRFLSDIDKKLVDYRTSTVAAFAKGSRQRRSELSENDVQSEAATFADTFLDNTRKFYRVHDWVASINIPPCHRDLSQLRAERTVDVALDILRLFITSMPERYRRANVPNTPFETYELVSDRNERVSVTVRKSSRSGIAGEGWYEELLRSVPKIWPLFEQAIEVLPGGGKPDELNQRLLDAINWFGQAILEPNPAAKVVKYTAALERLTITGHVKSGELELLLLKRVCTLNYDRTDKTPQQIEKEIGNLYQCRSDLMHGTMSPYSTKISEVLRIGWETTRWSILNAAQLFASLREAGKCNRKQLGAAYDNLPETLKK